MSKTIWLISADRPYFFSTRAKAFTELNYIHHRIADDFSRDMTDKETGFMEFRWELVDMDTQLVEDANDPWSEGVWVSTASWYNSYTQDHDKTTITILEVPLDLEFGEEKFDHAEQQLLLAEDHLGDLGRKE